MICTKKAYKVNNNISNMQVFVQLITRTRKRVQYNHKNRTTRNLKFTK